MTGCVPAAQSGEDSAVQHSNAESERVLRVMTSLLAEQAGTSANGTYSYVDTAATLDIDYHYMLEIVMANDTTNG